MKTDDGYHAVWLDGDAIVIATSDEYVGGAAQVRVAAAQTSTDKPIIVTSNGVDLGNERQLGRLVDAKADSVVAKVDPVIRFNDDGTVTLTVSDADYDMLSMAVEFSYDGAPEEVAERLQAVWAATRQERDGHHG